MNGYVEAGYSAVVIGVGGYIAYLTQKQRQLKRLLVPIRVDQERRRPKGSEESN
ncbi:MAG: CcmD family protein [Actinomycetota bacterium]|nr:CcmD family protein [Actinomycetota bacterium]